MDANWIFGLLAILVLLDYVYKQVVGRSFHHAIPRPVLWILVIVSSISAACCFALAWHTYSTPDFLLTGSSAYWLLLGIFLTGLAIAWLLPIPPDTVADAQKTRAAAHKQPLLPRNSMAGSTSAFEQNAYAHLYASERPTVFASSRKLSDAAPMQSLPFPSSSAAPLRPVRQLTKPGRGAPPFLPPALDPMTPLSSAALARPRGAPQMLVIVLMSFALLAVGWQLGHIFALSQSETPVAVARPVLRPTPTTTPMINASLTERLMAQTIANAPVAAPTTQPQTTPTTASLESIAFAITPRSNPNTTLKAKPAFEVADANLLPPVEFRRGIKSAVEAPSDLLPAAMPIGGPLPRGYYEPQSPAIRLLEPVDGIIVRDVITLRWSVDFELPPEQHYEVVAWLEDQNPFEQGISLAPLTSADQVRVNLALLDQALGPRFDPGIYRWGVMLVQRSPYQRIALLSDAQTLYYVPVE